jgi:hypothetical protein
MTMTKFTGWVTEMFTFCENGYTVAMAFQPLIVEIQWLPLTKIGFLMQRCDSYNNSAKNKRCCFSCWDWRDGIAPLSTAGISIADALGDGGTSFCSSKNDAPNNATPHKVGSPTKRGAKRKSPS